MPSASMLLTAPADAGLVLDDRGRGRPVLLLHGGGGPATMTRLADLLVTQASARVLLPTHPGFAGTVRPPVLASPRDLAALYVDLLDRHDLEDVTVLGSSFGGWVAAEMALLASHRTSTVVVVDGIGIEVEGHPLTDVRGLSPAQLRALSFADPSRAPAAPPGSGSGPSPDVRALLAYAGPAMSDPGLLTRLAAVRVPVHVLWGAADGIVDTAYGAAFAAAVPGAGLTVLPDTGHLPQLETPEVFLAALRGLLGW